MIDISQVSRGTCPVSNNKVFAELKSISMREILREGQGNPRLKEDFFTAYTQWLKACTVAPVSGLDQFPHVYFVNGVTQSYDIFFLEYKERRFRVAKGDYPYIRLSVNNWCYLEEDDLREQDVVVLSCPFYENGRVPRNLPQILDRCLELDIPVMLDAAYYGTCYEVEFDYSHPAIELVGFSLSKPFSVQSYRIGIQFSKKPLNYLDELQNQARYFNQVGAYIGLKLLQKFPADFIPKTYRQAQHDRCQQLDLLPTNCIMLANVKPDDHRFDQILEDHRFEPVVLPEGAYRRVCISPYLSDPAPRVKMFAKNLLAKLSVAQSG